jgi:hypothetical protein
MLPDLQEIVFKYYKHLYVKSRKYKYIIYCYRDNPAAVDSLRQAYVAAFTIKLVSFNTDLQIFSDKVVFKPTVVYENDRRVWTYFKIQNPNKRTLLCDVTADYIRIQLFIERIPITTRVGARISISGLTKSECRFGETIDSLFGC